MTDKGPFQGVARRSLLKMSVVAVGGSAMTTSAAMGLFASASAQEPEIEALARGPLPPMRPEFVEMDSAATELTVETGVELGGEASDAALRIAANAPPPPKPARVADADTDAGAAPPSGVQPASHRKDLPPIEPAPMRDGPLAHTPHPAPERATMVAQRAPGGKRVAVPARAKDGHAPAAQRIAVAPSAPAILRGRGARMVALRNLHTGEATKVAYYADGRYLPAAMRELDHLLRDHRNNQVRRMDPGLYDIMHAIAARVDRSPAFEIVSGYRSPATNAMLRRRSRGVARNSYHIKGMAVDLCMPHCDLGRIRSAALSLGAGGVGYYPKSGFVHVDVGPRRSWG